jgi:WhiB family redox-sensing transcriptional regulator
MFIGRTEKEVIAMMLSRLRNHVSVSYTEIPCREDPDLWFAESPAGVELAKALCHGCPFRLPCLAGARHRGEPWGVWGGELFDAGVVVPRKRGRGRPRKSDVAA